MAGRISGGGESCRGLEDWAKSSGLCFQARSDPHRGPVASGAAETALEGLVAQSCLRQTDRHSGSPSSQGGER